MRNENFVRGAGLPTPPTARVRIAARRFFSQESHSNRIGLFRGFFIMPQKLAFSPECSFPQGWL
jgi:hypothetical protein